MAATYPKVSVNVVTYNQEAFLAETLDSILAENYPNLEIVITDDASRDATPAIIENYAARFPNVIKTSLAKVNTGIASNANRGLALCTGEYICPFAGDDLFLPGKLAAQVALMESDPTCTISYHNVEWFNSATGKTLRLHFEPGKLTPTENGTDLFADNVIPGPAVMLRRSAMPTPPNHPDFPFCADWLHWILLSRKGTLRYLDKPLVRYRRHAENETLISTRVGTEQLRFIQYLRKSFPDAPAASLNQAEALTWQVNAIVLMRQGQFFKAFKSLLKTATMGRITLKNTVAMAVCLSGCLMPLNLRISLAKYLTAQRYK